MLGLPVAPPWYARDVLRDGLDPVLEAQTSVSRFRSDQPYQRPSSRWHLAGTQLLQPVAKVADPAWPRRGRVSYTERPGDGQETGGAPGVADVGGHGGPSDERWASLLRAAEPGPGGFRIRCVRRGVVRGLLRGPAGTAESASGSVFPDAVHRLFRGSVVGARDCVAGGGFAESAVVSGPGADRGGAGSLDAVAHPAADRRRDSRGGIHVDSGAAVCCGSGSGEDGRHRCDDAGSERGDAEH